MEEKKLLRKKNIFKFLYYYLKGWAFFFGIVFISENTHHLIYFLMIPFLGLLNFRLALFGHDSAHGLLAENKRTNEFIGRYFCHFPFFISHSKYRAQHILHHRFIGSYVDVDKNLYSDFPTTYKKYLFRCFKNFITLKTLREAFGYFTDLSTIYNKSLRRSDFKSDLPQFLLFWVSIFSFFIYFDLTYYLIYYWLLPLFLSYPYIEFVNALQHAPIRSANPRFSRNVYGEWYVPILLPLNINFHGLHHADPSIPFYNLKYNSDVPCESFKETLDSIFSQKESH